MLSRINFFDIIKNHFLTLRSLNQAPGKVYWKDVVLFIIFPFISSVVLVFFEIALDSQVSNLISVISIFGGFLFNLLAIVYGYLDKFRSETHSEIQKRFAEEINVNISFNILLSIFTTVSLVVYNLIPSRLSHLGQKMFKDAVLCINYFLIILFLLTLLMVLNRIYTLLQRR